MPGEKKEFNAVCFGLQGESGEGCRALPDRLGLNIVKDGAVVAHLAYRSTRVSLTGTNDRYILFESVFEKDRLRLLVPDRAIASEIAALGAPAPLVDQLNTLLGRRARRAVSTYLAVSLALCAALASAAAVWLAWDWALAKAVDQIPVAWEETLGEASAEQILQRSRSCGDPGLMRAIREIGMRLVSAVGLCAYDIRLQVLDVRDVNAFALPGGHIFVNRGLVEAADDGYEIAGVVAHEIAHLLKRHGLVGAVRQVGAGLLFSAVFGDSSRIEPLLIQGTLDLAALSYSRDQESEADSAAVQLLYKASLDPTGMERLLAKLDKQAGSAGSLPTILSSHPAPKERIARLRTLYAVGSAPALAPLNMAWADVKMRCETSDQASPNTPEQ